MGATQSGIVSVDEFKNYLYGTFVLMLSPQLDTELKFVECEQIKDEDKHVLPLVSNGTGLSYDEMILQYMQYYGNSGKEEAIDKYVKAHILDTNEHTMGFIKTLVSRLQSQRKVSDLASCRTQNTTRRTYAPAPAVQVQAPVPAPQVQPQVQAQSQVQAQPQAPAHEWSQPKIRGQHKLQRRLAVLGNAIDQERTKTQMQSYTKSGMEGQYEVPEIEENIEEPTEDGEYEQRTYSANS